MKILITGCCGFIGTNLCLKLLENENFCIYGIDNIYNNYNTDFKLENLELLKKYEKFIFYQEDLLVTDKISLIKPDKIIHLASIPGVRKSLDEPLLYVKNNIETFVKILEDCKNTGIKDIIYASSSSVYGKNEKIPFCEEDRIDNLQSSYACSKKCMEVYAKYYHDVFQLNTIGLRFFTVYGPHGRPDMAPFMFLKNIAEGKSINQYGDGTSIRDYTFVDDIVNGIISIVNGNGQSGEIYNLGNNKPVSLLQFISLCEKITRKKAIINRVGNQTGDVPKTYADLEKSYKYLNYKPRINLEQGLKMTYEWMVENKRIILHNR